MLLETGWLASLLDVAVRLSGLMPMAAADLPPLIALPLTELRQQACPLTPENCGSLVAMFDADGRRILVSDRLDVQDARDRSFIVHELVHVLEHPAAGSADRDAAQDDSCEASLASERRAYRVQNAYLREQGANERYGRMLQHAVCAGERVGAGGMLPLQRQMRDEPAIEAFMDDLARGAARPMTEGTTTFPTSAKKPARKRESQRTPQR